MGTNERIRKRNFRHSLVLVFALVLIGAALYIYERSFQGGTKVRVYFENPEGKKTKSFVLDAALTRKEQIKGLMYKKSGELKENEGMIFIYPEEEVRSMWMKNTYISLDMIFLNREFKVVGILTEVPVLNEEPRKVEAKSKYVIELLSGSVEREGVKVGSLLKARDPVPEAR